jgi:Malate/L-lactate dehydrogenase
VRADEAVPRLRDLGFGEREAQILAGHFLDAERRGKAGHGLARIEWLAGQKLDPGARPERLLAAPGFERWDGRGSLGYLTLAEICGAQIASPPEHARVVVASNCFPTGMLGHWTRQLAEAGLVALLTATSPPRLAHPDGGPALAGTNPLSIAVPSSDGQPVVADASMGRVTYGDVIAGLASEDELVPFGGEQAHKAFALALGLQLLVDALAGPTGKADRHTGKAGMPSQRHRKRCLSGRASSGRRRRGALAIDGQGAVLLVAHPEADPVPALRRLAEGIRLPGDGPSEN